MRWKNRSTTTDPKNYMRKAVTMWSKDRQLYFLLDGYTFYRHPHPSSKQEVAHAPQA